MTTMLSATAGPTLSDLENKRQPKEAAEKYGITTAMYRLMRYDVLNLWAYVEKYRIRRDTYYDIYNIEVLLLGKVAVYAPIGRRPEIPSRYVEKELHIGEVRPCGHQIRVERNYASEKAPIEYLPERAFNKCFEGDMNVLVRDVIRHFDITCRRIAGMILYSYDDEIYASKLYQRLSMGREVADLPVARDALLSEYRTLKGE